MKNESISATELARNVAMSIDKVRYTRTSLDITKGAQVVATLSPPQKLGMPIKSLVELLSSLPKLGDDADAFAVDIETIKTKASLPDNPWD